MLIHMNVIKVYKLIDISAIIYDFIQLDKNNIKKI